MYQDGFVYFFQKSLTIKNRSLINKVRNASFLMRFHYGSKFILIISFVFLCHLMIIISAQIAAVNQCKCPVMSFF